ncbi:MAG: RDD family protein [Lewinella sp.]
MNVFGRYFLYLADCLIMLFVIGMQFFIFRGELPFGHDTDRWLPILLGGGSVGMVTLLGGTLYWTIVDYHDELTELRRSTIVSSETGEPLDLSTRFLRSFLKALTLFTFPVLMLFAVFSEGHRFLHDYIAKTERVSN